MARVKLLGKPQEVYGDIYPRWMTAKTEPGL